MRNPPCRRPSPTGLTSCKPTWNWQQQESGLGRCGEIFGVLFGVETGTVTPSVGG